MQPTAGYPFPPPTRQRLPFSLDLFSEGWTLFFEQPWSWVAIYLLFMVIETVIAVPLSMGVPIIGGILMAVPLSFLGAGLCYAAVKQVRGGMIAVEDLFAGLKRPGDVLIVGVLDTIAAFVAVLLCCIPFFVFLPMFFFAMFLVVDRGLGWRDALTHSYRAVKPYFWSAAIFSLIIVLINIAISITCPCLAVVATPVEVLALAVSYTIFYG